MKYKVLSEIKKHQKPLPSLVELEQVSQQIKSIPNQKGEYLRKIHYGCFLLCSESGLRISEAVKFDLNAKTRKGLYRISKCKGNKTRYVYVNKRVIQELKKNNWQPHQTNRFAFYHFLQKTKRELNISKNIELTPHTFRRAFTTYHANSGMPLPLLQKLLGHSSIRTTALYWQNIYGEDEDDDTADILAGKKWLENQKPPPPTEIAIPSRGNLPQQLPENSEPAIISKKPVISAEKPVQRDNSLLTNEQEKNLTITNYQPKPLISEISTKNKGKISLNISEQFPVITNQGEKPTREEILLVKIKNLEKQLAQVQAENNNLKLENKVLKNLVSAKQNKHLKVLIKQDQETETKIIQMLPFKGNK